MPEIRRAQPPHRSSAMTRLRLPHKQQSAVLIPRQHCHRREQHQVPANPLTQAPHIGKDTHSKREPTGPSSTGRQSQIPSRLAGSRRSAGWKFVAAEYLGAIRTANLVGAGQRQLGKLYPLVEEVVALMLDA